MIYGPTEMIGTTNRNHPHCALFSCGPVSLALAAQLACTSWAAPLSLRHRRSQALSIQVRDDSDDDDPGVQIWMPVVLIIFLLAITVFGLLYRRKNVFSRRSADNSREGRQLTAEQLAGSIANGSAATRTRRARRQRRTPSQISTVSLPAYAKEPGDQEVVIFRGPEDMEDAGMATGLVMEVVQEDAEEPGHASASERYIEMPYTLPDVPLLEHEDTRQLNLAQPDGLPRRSLDTFTGSDSMSSLIPRNAADIPGIGPAPDYDEVVNLSENAVNESLSAAAPPSLPPPQEVAPGRSGFRNILGILPNRYSTATRPPSLTHARSGSEGSHLSRATSQSRISHRTTSSTSSSLFNLSPFRSLTRQKSLNTNTLTSPSMISLHSISSPLPHTLIRTEFSYPKAGPTPDQIKLISSREALSRFGVPYGPDAIAFASSSRQDVNMPPPAFEEQPAPVDSFGLAGQTGLYRASGAGFPTQPGIEELNPPLNLNEPSAESELVDHEASIPFPPSPKGSLSELDPSVTREPLPTLKNDQGGHLFGFGSRSSSLQTFAAAVESPQRSGLQSDVEEEVDATTPRPGFLHVLEATDATITPKMSSRRI